MSVPILALFFIASCWSGSGDPAAENAFRRGNALYLDGAFQEAALAYRAGLEQGGNPGLFLYNQGLCLVGLDRYGEALLLWLTAQRILPRDPAIRRNIRILRGRLGLPDPASLESGFLDRLNTFTPAEYALAAAFSVCPCFLLLAVYFLGGRRFLKRAASVFALAAVLLASAWALGTFGPERPYGVAVRAAEVWSAPSPNLGERLFVLREGAMVEIREHRDGWEKILDGKGRNGWAREGELGLIQ